jgi:hypothetical protein
MALSFAKDIRPLFRDPDILCHCDVLLDINTKRGHF